MKKFLALAAVVLGLASCQTEPEGFDVNVGGEQDVNITVSLPEGTRADSALGAFDNVDFTKYDVRFQCEVHYGDQVKVLPVQYGRGNDAVATATFPVRLIANRDYTFVVWADLVLEGSEADLHYDTTNGLDQIEIKDWKAMDETRDAYTCSVTRKFTRANGIGETLTLTRPFAKLRVVTTDIDELMGVKPTSAKVEYTTPYYTSFNAYEQKPYDLSSTGKAHSELFDIVSYGESGASKTLFTDYFFAINPENGQAPETVAFTMEVFDEDDATIDEVKKFNTSIPVKRNYLTTIKGNILTYADDFTVEILPGFENAGNIDEAPYYNEIVEVGNATNLQEAINEATENTTIVLGGDIDLGELFGTTRAAAALPIVIAEDKVVVLDLNGHKITTPWENEAAQKHYYAFKNYGSLTIQDSESNGEIIARGIFNYGTMTLESGIINACDGNGGYGVRNYEDAKFIMDGGSIITSLEDDNMVDKGGYDATTLRVDEGATATINGGTIENRCDFTSAIENYGTTTVNGGTITSIHTTIYNSASVIINDAVVTCNGLAGVTSHTIYTVSTGKVTINGGTFAHTAVDQSATGASVINGNVEVNAGTFTGRVEDYNGTPVLKGGNYSEKPADKYVASGYEVVEENDVYTVAKSQAVVAFEEAIAQGGEVTLNADIALAETVVIESGKTVVLNLNGKTISGNWHKDNGAVIENNGTLTIVGGTISSTGDNGGSAVKNNGILTIENATLNGAPNANGSWPSYSVNNTGVMTANNTTITSYHGAVASYGDGAVVTLNDCTIDMAGIAGFTNHGIYTYNSGKVVVNGGTYANKATDQNATGASVINGAVEVNAGTFSGRIENYSGTPVLKGGTFSVMPNAKFVAEGYTVVEKNGAYKVVSSLVAKIGNDEYTSLQSAIEAVEDGETIVLQRDIDITTPAHGQNALNHAKAVNFTLDLNGKTIYADTGNSVFRYNISQTDATSNITVTFKNGTITSGDKTWCTVMAAGTSNDVKAIFNLENLTINASKPGDLAVKAWDYAVINAKNVTVNATKCAGGFYALGGEIVLDNCTVNQNGLHTAPYLSMALAVSNKGKMTVNSGNYTAEPTAAAEGYNQGTSHGNWCAGVMNSGGELIINGGTFANGNFGEDALATAARGLIFGDTASNIVINDGTFNALKTVIDYQNNLGVQPNPNIVINGGNFSANPTVVTSYGGVVLAEGKVAVQGAGGRWTLVDGVMDEAGLKAAFEQGGNIVLGADITVSETIVLAEGKTVVLDLNGKTLAAVDMNTIKNNGGNLTIKNGTVTRTGDAVGYSVNNASGEISVVDATVECGLYTSGSKMTATNANISHKQSTRHAIYAWNCEVTINSGTFHNDNAGNATLMASGSSIVTINGGTFSIADGRSTLGWTSSMIDQNSTAQVIVKGGLFNGGFRINSTTTTLTIEGGEFNTNNGSAFTDYTGTKVVKGGKFTDAGAQNWAKKYIAEGYEMNANGEVVAK